MEWPKTKTIILLRANDPVNLEFQNSFVGNKKRFSVVVWVCLDQYKAELNSNELSRRVFDRAGTRLAVEDNE